MFFYFWVGQDLAKVMEQNIGQQHAPEQPSMEQNIGQQHAPEQPSMKEASGSSVLLFQVLPLMFFQYMFLT